MIGNHPNIQATMPINKNQNAGQLVLQLGKKTQLPNENRNYCVFNQMLVDKLVKQGEKAVPHILNFLKTTNDEKAVTEGLYVLDRMIDAKVKNVDKSIYPTISRFNDTSSPNVQVMLAGIYRKIMVPDAFGPLCKMLIKDSMQPTYPFFDPTEEVGGAVLEYIKCYGAQEAYQKNKANNL